MADEAKATIDLKEWRNFIDEVRGRPSRASEILGAVFGVFGFKDIDDHFRNEEGPDGKWAKRRKSTQELYAAIASGRRSPPKGVARAAFNPANKILQLTGDMRKAVLPSNVKRVSAFSIMVFNNMEYSGRMNDGDPKRSLVARPFMWLGDVAMGKMAQMSIEMWAKYR